MTWKRTGITALTFGVVAALAAAARADVAPQASTDPPAVVRPADPARRQREPATVAALVATSAPAPLVAGMTSPVPQASGKPFTQRLWRRSLLFAVAVSVAVIVLPSRRVLS